jgi:predicted transcriptional regulator
MAAMPKPTKNPGELQLAILRALWERGEASVADVHADLAPRALALTTIATMLRKMEEKGLVRHRENGRQFLYRAAVAADRVSRSMVGELVDRLFDGDPRALVNHLLTEGEIGLEDLDDLRRRVTELEQKQRRERGGRP